MKKISLGVFFAVLAVLSGCGGGGPKPLAVTLSLASPQAVDYGQTLAFTATVTNDVMAKGVTWTVSGAGTLTGQTATGATYMAPAPGGAIANSSGTLTATSVADPTKTISVLINVTPPPAISTTTLPAAIEGTAYAQAVASTGGAGTLTSTVSVGSLPPGLSIDSSGHITGTATGPNGTRNFTVKVTDSSAAGAQSATQALSILVNLPAAPSITTTTLPAATEGTNYSQPLVGAGGLTPYTFTVSAGTLPAGLALNASTGVISGKPSGPNGTSSFTIKLTDKSNPAQTATQALSILVNLPAPPSITTTTMTAGVEFAAYNQTVMATGGLAPLTFSISAGALPAGLAINASAGAITGTPGGPNGSASFTVKVTDSSNPAQSATQALSILINLPTAPSITTTTLPAGTEFTPYSQPIAVTGGHGTLTFSNGVGMPAGLSLNSSTGLITGTPSGPNGTSPSFTVTVTDSSNPPQSATKSFTILINLPTAPSITTTSLPNGSIGSVYGQTVAETGGHGPFTWSIFSGALPANLSINLATGAITGTPTANVVASFTVQVTDSSNPPQSAQKALTITIAAAPLSVTTTGLPAGEVGLAYTGALLQTTGGTPPVTWTASPTPLPAGLSLNASTGAITGTPTVAATTSFTFTATDSSVPTAQTASKLLSIPINAGLTITTTSVPSGTQGTAYSFSLAAAGGVGPYTWTLVTPGTGPLPAGLNPITSAGLISGVPTVSGTFPFTVQVTDSLGATQTANVSLVLAAAPALSVTTTSGSLPQGTLNTTYPSTNLNATGGIQPYTWTLVLPGTGPLPTGLSLSSSGQITGTTTAPGTFPFTVKVTDSISGTAQAALSITVNAAACAGYGTGNESTLHGSYAFLFQGMNGTGTLNPVAAAGSFTADGAGNFTAGEIDVNQTASGGGLQHFTVSAAGSSYLLRSDNRGCMVLAFGGNNQVVLHFAVGGISSGVASKGRVIEFDDTDGTGGRGSGIIRLQTVADFGISHLNARYAFGLDGTDISANHFALGGAFNVNPSTGALSNGYADVDDGGSLISAITGATGTIGTISATTGRAAASFNGGVGATYNWAFYVVNKNEIFIVSTDAEAAGTAISSGRAIVTGSSFSSSSLSGNYIAHLSGSGGGNAGVALGLLNFSSGALNGSINQYDTGSGASTSTITGGTYSVNATSGRVTVSGAGNHSPVIYLTTVTDGISAFFIGTDGNATFGLADFQPAATYSTNSLSGNGGKFFFGEEDPSDNTIDNQVGTVTITPSTGAVAGSQDSSGPNGLQTAKVISGTFVVTANGTGNLGSGTFLITNGTKIFFIDEGGGAAKISVVEQ
jgi:hypothetical protein